MTQQPEALRLADWLDRIWLADRHTSDARDQAAAELRRLSDVERALKIQGKALRRLDAENADLKNACRIYDKALEEGKAVNAQLLNALEELVDSEYEFQAVAVKARAAIEAAKRNI